MEESAPSSPEGAICSAVCAHAATLHCGSVESCRGACDEMHRTPVCREQLDSFMTCASRQPVGNWECDDSKTPALKDGHCDSQQAAFMACLQVELDAP